LEFIGKLDSNFGIWEALVPGVGCELASAWIFAGEVAEGKRLAMSFVAEPSCQ
jgi:hypothetical protein